jgi:hypothetical protein
MTANARLAAVAPLQRISTDGVERVLAERTTADLVTLAQELLLLDPRFERAFPRERTRHAAPGIVAASRRVLRRDAFASELPRPLRRDLEQLHAAAPRNARQPSSDRILDLVESVLRTAAQISPRAAAPHFVRAQRDWLFEDSSDPARRGFEQAHERARSPRAAATALLHLAILRADRGDVDGAHELLESATRLHPRSLAIAWTLAVYAAATGRAGTLERQLPSIARNADSSSLRRRALSLERHLLALARLGVLAEASVRTRCERLLARLPPLPTLSDGGIRR